MRALRADYYHHPSAEMEPWAMISGHKRTNQSATAGWWDNFNNCHKGRKDGLPPIQNKHRTGDKSWRTNLHKLPNYDVQARTVPAIQQSFGDSSQEFYGLLYLMWFLMAFLCWVKFCFLQLVHVFKLESKWEWHWQLVHSLYKSIIAWKHVLTSSHLYKASTKCVLHTCVSSSYLFK